MKLVNHLGLKNKVAGVFFVLSKALDTVSHTILAQKLELCGFRGLPIHLMKSYLSNRKQTVCIRNYDKTHRSILSSARSVLCGIPQGSILGTLLCLFYVNDLSS